MNPPFLFELIEINLLSAGAGFASINDVMGHFGNRNVNFHFWTFCFQGPKEKKHEFA